MFIFRCESIIGVNFVFAANLRLATTQLLFEVPSLRIIFQAKLRFGVHVKKLVPMPDLETLLFCPKQVFGDASLLQAGPL